MISPLFSRSRFKCSAFLLSVASMFTVAQAATFDWDTAIDNGASVEQTVSGVTATATYNASNADIVNVGAGVGVDQNTVYPDGLPNQATLAFGSAIDVTSIYVLQTNPNPSNLTFTPTGGGNAVVGPIALAGGSNMQVNLNWTGVTSFTIASDQNTDLGHDSLVWDFGNTAPVLGGTPGDDAATEDLATAIDLSAYNISDADGDTVTLTLAVDRGTVASVDGNGVTAGVTVAASGTASMTLQGTAANLNTYLNDTSKITYTTALNDNTAAVLTVTPNDGTENGTADTVGITITPVNDEPTLTATGGNPTYREGGVASDLFNSVTASTIEATDTFSALTLTVTNLGDGANEILNFDGSDVTLTNGTNVVTVNNTLSVNVVVIGSTATVSFTGGGLSNAEMQTLVDALTYRNSAGNPSTAANRVVTLTSVSDTGGTANGGDDTAALSIASTVTVQALPSITSATYNAATNSLVVTGANMEAEAGALNDIDASNFTFTAEGGDTYTLTDTPDSEISSATEFTLSISATDQTALEQIFNNNGTVSTGGTTYNLAAADDWNRAVTGADSSDATNGVTVSGVPVPTITSATFNHGSGALVVTGTGFVRNSGANNDVDVSALTLTGEGGNSYTLTTTDVEITNGMAFSVTLNALDSLNVRGILNKDGTTSDDATTYNLAAAEDWMAGSNAAVNIADTTGNSITVSNYSAPTVASATYDFATGVVVVTANDLAKQPGATNDIDASTVTFTGEGGGGSAYTLTDTADVEVDSGTQFTLTLSATDRAAINVRLNNNGTTAQDATTYNLAAADNWLTAAAASTDIADATNGITVSNVAPAPTVTDANISISGASGTGGAFKIGDTVTATWNNTAGGDNNAGVTGVTVDFSEFGGGAAVTANNAAQTWTATYTILAGVIDTVNRNVSVTATNGTPATTADTTNATVDNIAPTVTTACISVAGANGTGGAFINGDTAVPTWDNTGGCDANGDIASVSFAATDLVAADTNLVGNNAAQTWTATLSAALDAQNDTNNNITVTVVDDAGNSVSRTGTNNYAVNTNLPIVSALVATPTDTTASLTWTTDVLTSTQASTGFAGGTLVPGAVTNTAPRVTSHTVNLAGLRACTGYDYTVTSVDGVGNAVTSTTARFTTTGCDATSNSVVASTGVIPNGAPTPLIVGAVGDQLTITPAANYSATCDAIFQVADLTEGEVIGSTGASPTGQAPARAYALSAYCDDGTTQLTAFDNPITVSLNYSEALITGLEESSLQIYRWNGAAWTSLNGCAVDAAANTISCNTTQFSTFSVFASATAGGGGGGGGAPTVGSNTGVLNLCNLQTGENINTYPNVANGEAFSAFKSCQLSKGVFDESCVENWITAMNYTRDLSCKATTTTTTELDTVSTVESQTTLFADVPDDHPQAEAIAFLKQEGVVEGYADGTFKPDQILNRAEFLKIMAEAANQDSILACRRAYNFSDVDWQSWYGTYLQWALCQNIMQGYPDQTVRPSSSINFVEAAKLAVLALGFEVETDDAAFWFSPYVQVLDDFDAIPSSITSNSHALTRGEMAYLIWKLMTN